MKKDELIQVVRDYVNNEHARYAVLINGDWGSGKTYLYKKDIKKEVSKIEIGKDRRKVNVYISLYGINSVEQLSKEIVTHYLLEVKFNGNDTLGKAYKRLNKFAGVLSKTFTLSINGINADFNNLLEEFNDGIKFKDMVICFDDLERCSIPVNDLFGIINNLVEHCNCKVLILADEDNIGKMYANTNIEAKYASLLMGRKIKAETNDKKNSNNPEELTIERLKELNEKVYSENYIYKNIKEKVIGLSIKYTPDIIRDFEDIVDSSISNDSLKQELLEKKDKILKCMIDFNNNNYRIIKTWLINFEKIFHIIHKNFFDSQYYNIIFENFMLYSIRVACALGKNISLQKWDKEVEVGWVKIDDGYMSNIQGYKFIDELYMNATFNEKNVCKAVKIIEIIKEQEETKRKKYNKESALKKLNGWLYLEDSEVRSEIEKLKNEIENKEYLAQSYQSIVSLLITLKKEGFIQEDDLMEVVSILHNDAKNNEGKIEVENLQQSFSDDDLIKEFHKHYDPLYNLLQEKNREKDKEEFMEILNLASGAEFYEYCRKNKEKFLDKKCFINFIDLTKLENIIFQAKVIEIYDIISGFKSVYNFGNLYEYYKSDLMGLSKLKDFVNDYKLNNSLGITRKIAINEFISTLEYIITRIEKKVN